MPPTLELRCPGCTAVLARVRRGRLTIGRPFEECPKCHAFAQRPSTNEWDLLGAGRKVAWMADRIVPYLLLGLLPALAYWTLVIRDGGGERRLLLALLGAGPILIVLLPISSVVRAIRRSRSRMADPMYRARLVEFLRRAPSAGRS